MSGIKKIITLILVVLLLLVAVVISSLNADSVPLNLYWYQFDWPLGFTLLLFSCLSAVLGMMLAWLVWTWPANKQKAYWKRAYFNLKQEQEQLQTDDVIQTNKTNSSHPELPSGTVKIP